MTVSRGQLRSLGIRVGLLLFVALLAPAPRARAIVPAPAGESITLMWDACTDTNAAGYVIYHGPVGSGITNSTVLANHTTTAIVSNLTAGLTYFFFVTAYDVRFLESDPSNVIFDTPPPTSGTNTLGASNTPPRLAPIAAQTVTAGQPLTFTAKATDTDIPAQTLTFSLAAGAPAGASINPVSGVFTWTPSLAHGGSLFSVTIRTTDNGSPSQSVTRTVSIIVTSVPLPTTLGLTATLGTAPQSALLSWTADANPNWTGYIVSYGEVGGVVTNVFSIPLTNSLALENLSADVPQFFFLTPFDALFHRSQQSEVVSVTPLAAAFPSSNSAPELFPIGNKTVTAGSLLTFAVSATDAEFYEQDLTFSLASSTFSGASITPITGIFSWTPARTLGGTTNHVTFRVTDNGSPSRSDTQTIAIVVGSASLPSAPSLFGSVAAAPATVTLNWTASADPYVTRYILRYGLTAGPTNTLAVTTTSATLTSLQGGSTYFFFVAARNDLNLESPPSHLITLTPMLSPNTPPRLAAIGNKTVTAGTPLTFAVTARDTNVPTQTLTFDVAAGAPAGASINPINGSFAWTPARALGGTTNHVTFRVTDNGSPPLSATQRVSIIVTPDSFQSSMGLTVVPGITPESVWLSWSVNANPNWIGYIVSFGAVGGDVTNAFSISSTNSILVENLPASAPHFFFVTPFDALFHRSPQSEILTATPSPPLAGPTQLQATFSGAGTLQLAWNCAPKAMDAFQVEASIDGVNFEPIATTSLDARTCDVPEGDLPRVLDYPYVFRVCAFRGSRLSPYSNPACALTNQAELVITALRTVPAFPVAGQPVLFQATVQNKGGAASPQRLNARVAFYVNGGSAVAWANAFQTLWPGQSAEVIANAGPSGTNTWLATAGNFTLTAIVDDAALLAEQDAANNNFSTNLIVPPASAPIVSVTLDLLGLTPSSTNVAHLTFTRTGSTEADLPVQINISGTLRDGGEHRCIPTAVIIPAQAASLSVPLESATALLIAFRESITFSLAPSLDYQVGDDCAAILLIQE